MTALIACDLDRTLIYSKNAIGTTATDLVCVEHYDGGELSYMTPHAISLLHTLATEAVVVPATTRTIAQYQRVRLPDAYRYAVCSSGGNILVDGVPDESWRAAVDARIAAGGPPLDEIVAELHRRISDDWVRNFRIAEDLFCYVVVDLDCQPDDFVPDWGRWCAPRGWVVSQQGRKIYTVPETLCKSSAVAEIARRLPEVPRILAAGDGALDAELLKFAHAAIRPRHGELEALGWQSDHLTVTAAAGVLAAEELLQWFRDEVASSTNDRAVGAGRDTFASGSGTGRRE